MPGGTTSQNHPPILGESQKFEDRVFLDQDLTFQVRLFVYLLPESVYQERMRKANLNAQKKGRQIGKEFKARARLNLFITSASEELLDMLISVE